MRVYLILVIRCYAHLQQCQAGSQLVMIAVCTVYIDGDKHQLPFSNESNRPLTIQRFLRFSVSSQMCFFVKKTMCH